MNESLGLHQRLQQSSLEMLRQLQSELDTIHLIQPKKQIQGRAKLGAINQGQEKYTFENSTVDTAEIDDLKIRLEESVAEVSRLQGLMDQMDELFPLYDSLTV
jgi:hypothetical protein